MAALRHPNLILFMGACTTPPTRAIVTELATRGSLWDVLRDSTLTDSGASAATAALKSQTHQNEASLAGFATGAQGGTVSSGSGGPGSGAGQVCGGALGWSRVHAFALGAARGLCYLHGSDIVHRDLKTPNLLVTDEMAVKVSDFGLARVKAHTQTMTGNCGTLQWMAPEVSAPWSTTAPHRVRGICTAAQRHSGTEAPWHVTCTCTRSHGTNTPLHRHIGTSY
jgi:serine/threonine protein kinase